MGNERLKYIDCMKGIGIVLVVLGHVSMIKVLTKIIFSFHMPLFFMISGITYFLSKRDNFYIKKVRTLLIPYLFFSLISFIYWVLIERYLRNQGNISVSDQFINVFLAKAGSDNYIYNAPLWFLPCIFVVTCFFHFFNNKIKWNKVVMPILIIFISIMGFILSKYLEFRLPFSLDSAMQGILFFGMGYYVSPNIISEATYKKKIKFTNFIVGLIMLLLANHFNDGINISENKYDNYMSYLLGAFVGVTLIYLFAKNMNSKILTIFGENSLIIMCIHEPVKRVVIQFIALFFNTSGVVVRTNIISVVITTIVTLGISLFASNIIKKIFPFVVGKKYKKEIKFFGGIL
ncbi:hypothetical protein B0533_13485 [Sedimentibacter sp. SX930]|nr:hypothetical protein B0533_13485 [Sedimentibacter sp. SX930]